MARALLLGAALIGATITSGAAPHPAASDGRSPVLVGAAPRGHRTASADAALTISDTRLLGQRIMVGFDGTVAPLWLLAHVRAGEVGSVILFAQNIVSSPQLRALSATLQRAARAGGNPPVLIATDQEGGQVKRLPAGPPDLSPPQMAASGAPATALAEGRATGRFLKALGINWDLAPILDVPTFSGAFIWQQGRAFSFSANSVASLGSEFALGLQQSGVAAAGKHFPGLGSAAVDTDNRLEQLHPTLAQRAAALVPYRTAITRGLWSVMLSTAAFGAYDPSGAPAALSAPIAQGLLRGKLGFHGVSITDALGTPTGHDEKTAGVLAARAGADVLLYTDSAPGELSALRSALGSGRVARSAAQAAYARIVALKRRVG